MNSDDLAALDERLMNPPRMTYGECVGWIGKLKAALVESRSANRSTERALTVLQALYENPEGARASALRLLREHGRVPLQKAPEPPLDKKRAEFMALWKSSDPKVRAQLETAAAGDAEIMALVAKEKK